jgi:hypothetical protein
MPLAILVFTPKGNVPHVSATLMQAGLMLDHPTSVFDLTPILHRVKYYNPHNPPPGGFRAAANGRSNPLPLNTFSKCSTPQVPSKSVEIQRSQVEDVFQKLRSEDDLKETSPGTCPMIYVVRQIIFPLTSSFPQRSRHLHQSLSTSEKGGYLPARTRTGNRMSGRKGRLAVEPAWSRMAKCNHTGNRVHEAPRVQGGSSGR